MNGEEMPFEMSFDMAVIDNLGIRMYTTLPPVVAELVSNSWDADATTVRVMMPEGPITSASTIQVEDNGTGMSKSELQSKYLVIGKNRRNTPDETTPGKKRKLMGRKGIGKLSVFGVAKDVEITTVKNGCKNAFVMSIDEILSSHGTYRPRPIYVDKSTDEEDGTAIVLRNLKRKTKLEVDQFRDSLSRRFSVLSDEFNIVVNGRPLITLAEIVSDNIFILRDYKDKEIPGTNGGTVNGWIAVLDKIPSHHIKAGVCVNAHGKLIQEPFFFGEPESRHYGYAYTVGALEADFLDELDEDIVSATRKTIDWEGTEEALKLKEWGKKELLELDRERTSKRRVVTKTKILEKQPLSKWYDDLSGSERAVADRTLDVISDTEMPFDEKVQIASQFSKSFESKAYQTILDKFQSTNPDDLTTLIGLMDEWHFVESKYAYDTLIVRKSIILKLKEFIDNNAYEKTIQGHLYDSPWLIHPTWMSWEKERSLAKLLTDEFPSDEDSAGKRRVDIICVGASGDLYVIELKRPDVKVGNKEMEQLLDYTSYLEAKIQKSNNTKTTYRRVNGYIIGEEIKDDRITRKKMSMLMKDGHTITTYRQLLADAVRLHEAFIENIEDEMNLRP